MRKDYEQLIGYTCTIYSTSDLCNSFCFFILLHQYVVRDQLGFRNKHEIRLFETSSSTRLKACLFIFFTITICILQQNIQHLFADGQEFKVFLADLKVKPDGICVRNTFLKPKYNFTLPG